jgi:hypothetical protein
MQLPPVKSPPDNSTLFNAEFAYPLDSKIPYAYVAMAIEAMAELDLHIEVSDRLLLTIRLALEARHHFFDSAYFDPTDDELDEHFIDFVIRSVRRRPLEEEA